MPSNYLICLQQGGMKSIEVVERKELRKEAEEEYMEGLQQIKKNQKDDTKKKRTQS